MRSRNNESLGEMIFFGLRKLNNVGGDWVVFRNFESRERNKRFISKEVEFLQQ